MIVELADELAEFLGLNVSAKGCSANSPPSFGEGVYELAEITSRSRFCRGELADELAELAERDLPHPGCSGTTRRPYPIPTSTASIAARSPEALRCSLAALGRPAAASDGPETHRPFRVPLLQKEAC